MHSPAQCNSARSEEPLPFFEMTMMLRRWRSGDGAIISAFLGERCRALLLNESDTLEQSVVLSLERVVLCLERVEGLLADTVRCHRFINARVEAAWKLAGSGLEGVLIDVGAAHCGPRKWCVSNIWHGLIVTPHKRALLSPPYANRAYRAGGQPTAARERGWPSSKLSIRHDGEALMRRRGSHDRLFVGTKRGRLRKPCPGIVLRDELQTSPGAYHKAPAA